MTTGWSPFENVGIPCLTFDFTLALDHGLESNQPGLALVVFFDHLCLFHAFPEGSIDDRNWEFPMRSTF